MDNNHFDKNNTHSYTKPNRQHGFWIVSIGIITIACILFSMYKTINHKVKVHNNAEIYLTMTPQSKNPANGEFENYPYNQNHQFTKYLRLDPKTHDAVTNQNLAALKKSIIVNKNKVKLREVDPANPGHFTSQTIKPLHYQRTSKHIYITNPAQPNLKASIKLTQPTPIDGYTSNLITNGEIDDLNNSNGMINNPETNNYNQQLNDITRYHVTVNNN